MKPLPRTFYQRDTIEVAKDLLGKYLVHRYQNISMVGKIVEVEAYVGSHDLAAHSSKGITPRTAVMFGPAGYSYVYLIYGMYNCFNVVTEEEGQGTAVLLRALEPIQNISSKTSGPGLLCKAMHIDKSLNAHDLLSNNLFITNPTKSEKITIVKAPRVGVNYAKHWTRRLLRFYIKNNAFVSRQLKK